MLPNKITQDEVDALWLAARIHIGLGDVPPNLRARAQIRIQRLADAGIITHKIGESPKLVEINEESNTTT